VQTTSLPPPPLQAGLVVSIVSAESETVSVFDVATIATLFATPESA
jgi:hypothetical protein